MAALSFWGGGGELCQLVFCWFYVVLTVNFPPNWVPLVVVQVVSLHGTVA